MKPKQNYPQELPTVGRLRWAAIAPFVGVSREKFRLLSNAGLAPPRLRYSLRCTLFSAEEVHKWIKDPTAYRAPCQ